MLKQEKKLFEVVYFYKKFDKQLMLQANMVNSRAEGTGKYEISSLE